MANESQARKHDSDNLLQRIEQILAGDRPLPRLQLEMRGGNCIV